MEARAFKLFTGGWCGTKGEEKTLTTIKLHKSHKILKIVQGRKFTTFTGGWHGTKGKEKTLTKRILNFEAQQI